METKMHVDKYTKSVLTVIAICLVFLCLKGLRLSPLLYGAPSDAVDVRIRAIERAPGQNWDPVTIGIVDKLPVEVDNDGAIPVEVKNPLLAVDVKNVDVKSSLKPIDVKE
jgi:hypothetical protein